MSCVNRYLIKKIETNKENELSTKSYLNIIASAKKKESGEQVLALG